MSIVNPKAVQMELFPETIQMCPAETVTINEKVYSISEYVLDSIAVAGEAAHGYMSQKDQIIRYNGDQHPQQAKDTLLHEILHAIDFDLQIGLTEAQVHSLATSLCALLWNEDNKEIVDWIRAG